MNNTKSDEYYIMKILENIDNIQKIMENKTKEDLEEELITNNTIIFQFINMGKTSLIFQTNIKRVNRMFLGK